MQNLEDIKQIFNYHILQLKCSKNKNNQLFTRDEYFTFMARLKESKMKTTKKHPSEYQRMARYNILEVDGVERLVMPLKEGMKSVISYTYLEENFDIIHQVHVALNHVGRNRMMEELKRKYKNITVEIVMIYLNLCERCKKKLNVLKKRIISLNKKVESYESRVKIEPQSDQDNEYCPEFEQTMVPIKSDFNKEINSQTETQIIPSLPDLPVASGFRSVDVSTENQKENDPSDDDENDFGIDPSTENSDDQPDCENSENKKISPYHQTTAKKRSATFAGFETINRAIDKLQGNAEEHEFDIFCRSLAFQLKKMPLDRALICQQRLQNIMTEERLFQFQSQRIQVAESSSTSLTPSSHSTPLSRSQVLFPALNQPSDSILPQTLSMNETDFQNL